MSVFPARHAGHKCAAGGADVVPGSVSGPDWFLRVIATGAGDGKPGAGSTVLVIDDDVHLDECGVAGRFLALASAQATRDLGTDATPDLVRWNRRPALPAESWGIAAGIYQAARCQATR